MTDDTAPKPPHLFRLSEVTKRLRDVLLPVTAKKFWVRAQFVPERTRATGGHVYGQLVEADNSGKEIARMRVTIWKSDYERIEQSLRGRGADRLEAFRAGGEVCAECSVRYHEVFGLSLAIFDIDPDLGESQLDRKRRLILEGLQKDGLLGRNGELAVAAVPLAIGLITSAESAASADFLKTLNVSGFSFRIFHVASHMQGAATATSVVTAIERLQRESLDLICIIRGGGSPVDLAWLDDDRIARAVAHSRLPIWVGIGHEIDVGVLDHVAHSSHKTPTAVAEALVGQLRDVQARLGVAADRLLDATSRTLDLKAADLAVWENGLRQGTRKHLQIQNARFGQRISRLETLLAEHAERHASRFQQAATTLWQRTRALLEQASARLATAADAVLQDTARVVKTRQEHLDRSRAGQAQGTRKQLAAAADRLSRSPQTLRAIVERRTSRLVEILTAAAQRLRSATKNRTDSSSQRLGWWQSRLTLEAFIRRHERAAERLGERQRLLQATSPERLLERGYTITRTSSGRIVRSVMDVAAGETIQTRLTDGIVVSEVKDTKESTNG